MFSNAFYGQVRIYSHGVIQVDPVEGDDAGLEGDNEQLTSRAETLERAASSSGPQRQQGQLQQDSVYVFNPLFFPDIAAYAQRMLDDNIDVMAFPYIDDLHHQLSGPFVQSDGLKPSWAVTNRTTNRVEGAHKDAKHTEGSGSALSLVAFARQRLNVAVGARDAFFTRWQAQQQLATSRQRLQSQARRAESWFSSPNSSLVVLPGAPLSSAAAELAGMLPAASALHKLFGGAAIVARVGCCSTAAPVHAANANTWVASSAGCCPSDAGEEADVNSSHQVQEALAAFGSKPAVTAVAEPAVAGPAAYIFGEPFVVPEESAWGAKGQHKKKGPRCSM